jgi:hypothetical protein
MGGKRDIVNRLAQLVGHDVQDILVAELQLLFHRISDQHKRNDRNRDQRNEDQQKKRQLNAFIEGEFEHFSLRLSYALVLFILSVLCAGGIH